jgi:hypothetical protein
MVLHRPVELATRIGNIILVVSFLLFFGGLRFYLDAVVTKRFLLRQRKVQPTVT